MNRFLLSRRTTTVSWRRRLGTWAVGALLFYTVFGFLVVPWIVKVIAVKQLSKQLDREASIRQVRLNPFVLSVTLRGLLVKDKDGEPFLSVEEAYANFQLSSFFGNAWVFKEVWAISPFCRVQINRDSSLNFSDLTTKFSQPSTPSRKKTRPFNLHITRLQINGASASFTDLTPSTPFHRRIGPMQVTVTSFHTDPNNQNPYSFSGTTDGGEKFSWSGQFSLAPLQSAGELELDGLALAKYAPLFQDAVRFEIRDGMVDAHAFYRFALKGREALVTVRKGEFSLTNLRVAELGSPENLVELDHLGIRGVSMDTAARAGEVSNISVSGGRVVARRNKDESINLVEVSEPPAKSTKSAGGLLFLMRAATNAFAALVQSTNLWTGTLHELEVTNCAVRWEDLSAEAGVNCSVDELRLSARQLSNTPGSNQTATLSFQWNTNGQVSIDSTVQLLPPSADALIHITNVELQALSPYLKPYLNIFLLGSKVGVSGWLRMRSTPTNELPEITFTGNTRLDDFATVDAQTQDLVKWKGVQMNGIEAGLQPPAIAVKEIAVTDFLARVAFDTNQALNFLSVLKVPPTNSIGGDGTNSVVGGIEPHPATSTGGSLGHRLGALLEKALAPTTNKAGGAVLPKLTVETINITNGAAQFHDASVRPSVALSVQELNGVISHLSSDGLNRADLRITGKTDRNGPFQIEGTINPLNPGAETRVKILLSDMDLSPASPYSGKFLGYGLTRGHLGLQIEYEVFQKKMKAKNVVILDGLVLGEKIASSDATSLPVKLAIALLKDRNGKILIDIPIEGDLNDPKFHFGKVIAQVLEHMMTKIITSPFAALGAIFGGKGEEVSYQDFASGSSELQPANLRKIEALVSGLSNRPNLELQIEGSFDAEFDAGGLRKAKLLTEFRRKKWAALSRAEKQAASPDQVALASGEYQTFLHAAYASTLRTNALTNKSSNPNSPGGAVIPAQRKSASSPSDRGATRLLTEFVPPKPPTSDEEERVVSSTVQVTNEDFVRLAAERARNVQKRIFETGQIETNRVVLIEPTWETVTNHAARVFFHLQ